MRACVYIDAVELHGITRYCTFGAVLRMKTDRVCIDCRVETLSLSAICRLKVLVCSPLIGKAALVCTLHSRRTKGRPGRCDRCQSACRMRLTSQFCQNVKVKDTTTLTRVGLNGNVIFLVELMLLLISACYTDMVATLMCAVMRVTFAGCRLEPLGTPQ